MKPSGPSWTNVVAVLIAGVLLRVWMRHAYGLQHAFGEDAEYWGYRAVELSRGDIFGMHPPFYPGLMALLGQVPGVSLPEAAYGVSALAACLMAPAMILALTPLVGRGPAALTGWFFLLLPGLLSASMRVEPTGVFVCWIAAILYAAVRAARDRSVRWALVSGALVAASTAVKENGLLYATLLLPVIGVGLVHRRWVLAFAPVLALVVPYAAMTGIQSAYERGETSKVSVPLVDLQGLLESGRIPAPLMAREDPAISLSPEVRAEIRDADTTPLRRAWLYAGLQGRRLWRFLGAWLIVAPFAIRFTWRAWREGEIAGWQAGMLASLGISLFPAFVFIVQPRHVEPGALGILAATSLGLAALYRRAVLWPIPALLLLFAAQGAWIFQSREATSLTYLGRCAQEQQEVAWQLQGWIHHGALLCSPSRWVGFRGGLPVLDCDGEGEDEALVVGSEVYVLGATDEMVFFEKKLLRGKATVEWTKTFEGDCFKRTKFGRVTWE